MEPFVYGNLVMAGAMFVAGWHMFEGGSMLVFYALSPWYASSFGLFSLYMFIDLISSACSRDGFGFRGGYELVLSFPPSWFGFGDVGV